MFVPAQVIVVDELPVTGNGKIDDAALPAPSVQRPELGAEFTPPEGPAQQLIAEVFAEVLGLDRVGAGDDFFALGGHSLLVTQVTARIRDTLDIHLPLRQLFDTPTVAALAPVVEAAVGEQVDAATDQVDAAYGQVDPVSEQLGGVR